MDATTTVFTIAGMLADASQVISTGVTTTKELISEFPFMLLPAVFIFAYKFIGMSKTLTLQSRGGGRKTP